MLLQVFKYLFFRKKGEIKKAHISATLEENISETQMKENLLSINKSLTISPFRRMQDCPDFSTEATRKDPLSKKAMPLTRVSRSFPRLGLPDRIRLRLVSMQTCLPEWGPAAGIKVAGRPSRSPAGGSRPSRPRQAGQEATIIDAGPTDLAERSRIHRLLVSAIPHRPTKTIARANTPLRLLYI